MTVADTSTATVKTRRKPQGPRVNKPMFILYTGDNVEIKGATRDAVAVLDAKEADPSLKSFKFVEPKATKASPTA